MPSEKQIQASRTNGARSKGPITPQGKANSSRNSYRHGLLSSTVVLEEESTERFLEILTDFMDEFQPATVTQISLVETMAVARWRLLRIWGAQKTAMDRDMAMQDPADGPAAVRVLVALSSLSDNSCPPELLLRYEIAFDRQFSRALVRLLDLQSRRNPRQLVPHHPVVPPGDTWKPDEETREETKEEDQTQVPKEIKPEEIKAAETGEEDTQAAQQTKPPEKTPLRIEPGKSHTTQHPGTQRPPTQPVPARRQA